MVSNIEGGVKELPKTSVEEGPHTCLEGVPTRSQVTRGSNPTSTCTCSFPKFGGVGGVNSYEGKKGIGVGGEDEIWRATGTHQHLRRLHFNLFTHTGMYTIGVEIPISG